MQSRSPVKREPLFAKGAPIVTPYGMGVVRSHRTSRYQPGVIIYEVQLDNESCIRTWTEAELEHANPPGGSSGRSHLTARYVPGESVSTIDGEGIIRNLIRDITGVPHAIVQLIGVNQTRTVPCSDLSPPLEAA